MSWGRNRTADHETIQGARLRLAALEAAKSPMPSVPSVSPLPSGPSIPKGRCQAGGSADTNSTAQSNLESEWLLQPATVTVTDAALPTDIASPTEPVRLSSPSVWDRIRAARINPERRGVLAAAICGLVVLLLLGGVLGFKLWRKDATAAQPIALPSVAATASPSSAQLVVAVSGRVHNPGLVHVPAGARVADAVQAAGGALPDVGLGSLNLARKVADGELIVVGEAGQSDASPSAASPSVAASGASPAGHSPVGRNAAVASGALLDLNTATVTALEALPEVGPVIAQRIVAYRSAHGRFGSVQELRKVGGIGEAKFARLKPLVTA